MEAQNKKMNAGSDVARSYKVRAYRRDTLANVKSGLRGQTRSVSGAIGVKHRTRVAHWNVRTLFQTGKTHILANERKKYNVQICGISETHWLGHGNIDIEDYRIWYSGGEEDKGKHERGVGIAVERGMAGAVIKFVPVNDRIILLRFRFRHADLTVIEAYAPTEEAEDSVKEKFYYALQATLDTVARHDFKILMGNFNAKMGKESDVWGNTLGKFGAGDCNDNGERLLEMCCNNNLYITNTQFRQKPAHRNT